MPTGPPQPKIVHAHGTAAIHASADARGIATPQQHATSRIVSLELVTTRETADAHGACHSSPCSSQSPWTGSRSTVVLYKGVACI